MDKENLSLLIVPLRKKARIKEILGGHVFQNKLTTMGIRPGKEIIVVSRQPFRGPLTIDVCGCQMTIGRGMAQKILVDI